MSGSRTNSQKGPHSPSRGLGRNYPHPLVEMNGQLLIEEHVSAARLQDRISMFRSYTDDVGTQLSQFLLADARSGWLDATPVVDVTRLQVLTVGRWEVSRCSSSRDSATFCGSLG